MTELVGAGFTALVGGGALMFDGICSWRRIVSASGMPGVGVAPGFTGWMACFGSIPGVGVAPFGTFMTAFAGGMPGVVLADGGTGSVDIPDGRSLALAVLIFALVGAFTPRLTFVFSAVLQADADTAIRQDKPMKIFDINKYLSDIRHSNAGLKVASLGDSDGVQTGTGRCQTEFGR